MNPTPRTAHAVLVLHCLMFFLVFAGPAGAQESAEEFPGRTLYTTVPYMTLDELAARLAEVHVVDVRSKYEYDTLHIKGAHHVTLGADDFEARVAALKADKDQPVVFYCNGRSCYKSYKACDKALGAGMAEVYAYDAGIFDWARAHPEASVLLGKSPMDPARLISNAEFEKHLLSPEKFAEHVHTEQALVLDISDPIQRAASALFPNLQRSIALDRTAELDELMTEATQSGRTLLVYDEAGKQIRWFQYYLEDRGLKSYYFMKGGVKAFYKEVLMM